MSWTCPTCKRDVPIWEDECSHCKINPVPERAEPGRVELERPESERVAPSAAEAHAHTHNESVKIPPLFSLHPGKTSPPPSSPSGESASGWKRVTLVVGLAALTTMGALYFLLWPKQVSLQVQSKPGGATLLLDGKAMGKTPLKLSGLKEGQVYWVRLELDGYYPSQQTFVAVKRAKPWTIPLEPGDPLLDEQVIHDLVGNIDESAQEGIFSHQAAETLFTVNPLIAEEPWLTDGVWKEIFQEVVQKNFNGDSKTFLRHLQEYKAELAKGKTTKQAWYEHLAHCEKVCRPVIVNVFKRHLDWVRRNGFAMVFFPVGQSQLMEEDKAAVGRFVEDHHLGDDHSRQVLLVGRASKIGGQQYNLELSNKRVEAVTAELAAHLTDARDRLRTVHLGFEPPEITPAVAKFLGLDSSLSEAQLNQSVMLVVSEPLPSRTATL